MIFFLKTTSCINLAVLSVTVEKSSGFISLLSRVALGKRLVVAIGVYYKISATHLSH